MPGPDDFPPEAGGYDPEDFGGTDEESHLMSQTIASRLVGPEGSGKLLKYTAPAAVKELRRQTAALAAERRSGPGCLTPAAGTPIPEAAEPTEPAPPLPPHLHAQTVIFSAIADERERQERLKAVGKFVYSCADREIPHIECYLVLAEEVGEVAHELNETIGGHRPLDKAKLTKELIQSAAVIVAWLEKLRAENGGVLS